MIGRTLAAAAGRMRLLRISGQVSSVHGKLLYSFQASNPSSSLVDCLGRVRRVKAKPRPVAGEPDAVDTARGMAAIKRTGEQQGTELSAGRSTVAVPLACH